MNCKLIRCLIIILLFSCCSRQKAAEDGVLSVGVEINYPPMEYYEADGSLAGFDIDLALALAEKLGLKAKFIDVSWEGILSGLDTGKYDIAVNVTILPERQKKYNFTKPYIDSYMTITALKQSQFNLTEPEDIVAGKRVAFQGNTTAQYFTEKLSEKGVRFSSYSYQKIINCFDDLKLGRVDLIAADNIVAFNFAQQQNSSYEVIWSGPSDEYIAICLKKGNDALTAAIDSALDEMFKDGSMEKISYKYFKKDLVSSLRR